MKFQSLNRKLKNQDVREFKKRQINKKKLLIRSIIVFIVLTITIYLPVRMAYSAAKEINRHAKFIAAAAKNENLDDIRLGLKNTQKSVTKLNTSLNTLFWARFIPYFGGFYADAKHFVNAASAELKAAQIIADSLDPYKNELGFTGTPTPGQDRVSQFVKVLEKTLPSLDKVEPHLEKAANEVKNINVEKYPEKFGSVAVRQKVTLSKNGIIGAHFAVSEARSALEVAPSALGEPTAKNYLIIFKNDKEIRATGGFMTAYAYIKLDKQS